MPAAVDLALVGCSPPLMSGVGGNTLFAEVAWQDGDGAHHRPLVVRFTSGYLSGERPSGLPIPQQAALMALVREVARLPVPAVPFVEPDPRPLGAEFLVMERVEGRSPPDHPPYTMAGFLVRASTGDRRRAEHGVLRAVAQLHRAPWDAHLTRLEHIAGRAKVEAHELLDEVVGSGTTGSGETGEGQRSLERWLRQAQPPGRFDPVVNWGDARLGNVVFDRATTPVAMVDWESASLGPAERDVGWYLFMRRYFAELARDAGRGEAATWDHRAQLIERYEALAGRPVRHIEWFEALAAAQFATMLPRLRRGLSRTGPGALRRASRLLDALCGDIATGRYWVP